MKKNLLTVTFILSLSLLFSGCASQSKTYEKSFFAMDTFMSIKYTSDAKTDVMDEAIQLINDIEKAVSVTDSESEIYSLNQNKSCQVSPITYNLISSALMYCNSTNGDLDISIYPIVKAWGFTTSDAKKVPSDDTINTLLPAVDYKKIELNEDKIVSIPANMQIDLGAITKGYASDAVADLLKNNGIHSAIISLGGNVMTIGTRPDNMPWNVAINDPFSEGYAGVVSITDKAVVTSGDYERFFEENGKKYHHIMNPKTGFPAENGLSSVTIISDSGTMADALSTALFVKGLDEATKYWQQNKNFEAIFITTDGKLYITKGLEKSFTTYGNYSSQSPNIIQ